MNRLEQCAILLVAAAIIFSDYAHMGCTIRLVMCLAVIKVIRALGTPGIIAVVAYTVSFPPYSTYAVLPVLSCLLVTSYLVKCSISEAAFLGFALGSAKVFALLYWAFIGLESPILSLVISAVALGSLYGVVLVFTRVALRSRYFIFAGFGLPLLEHYMAASSVNLCPYCMFCDTLADNRIFLQLTAHIGGVGMSSLFFVLAAAWSVGASRDNTLIVRVATWLAVGVFALGVVAVATEEPRSTRRHFRIGFTQVWNPKGSPSQLTNAEMVQNAWEEVFLPKKSVDLVVLPEASLFEPIAGTISSSLTVKNFNDLMLKNGYVNVPVIAGTEFELAGDGEGLDRFRNSAVAFAVADTPRNIATVDKATPARIGETTIRTGIPVVDGLSRKIFGGGSSLVTKNHSKSLVIDGTEIDLLICSEHMLSVCLLPAGPTEADIVLIIADTRWLDYSRVERLQSRARRRLLSTLRRRPVLYLCNGGSEYIGPDGDVHSESAPLEKGKIWSIQICKANDSKLERERH